MRQAKARRESAQPLGPHFMGHMRRVLDYFLWTNRHKLIDHYSLPDILALRQSTALYYQVDGPWFRGEVTYDRPTDTLMLRLVYNQSIEKIRPGYVWHDNPVILLEDYQYKELPLISYIRKYLPIKHSEMAYRVDSQRLIVTMTFEDGAPRKRPPLSFLAVIFEPGEPERRYQAPSKESERNYHRMSARLQSSIWSTLKAGPPLLWRTSTTLSGSHAVLLRLRWLCIAVAIVCERLHLSRVLCGASSATVAGACREAPG